MCSIHVQNENRNAESMVLQMLNVLS